MIKYKIVKRKRNVTSDTAMVAGDGIMGLKDYIPTKKPQGSQGAPSMINTKLLEAWCLGAESTSAAGQVDDSKLLAMEIRLVLAELDAAPGCEASYLACQSELYRTRRKLELATTALKDVADASKGVFPNKKIEYIHKIARQGLQEDV